MSLEDEILAHDIEVELSALKSNLRYVEDYVKTKRYTQAVTYARAGVVNLVRIIESCAELRRTEKRE